MVKIFNFRNPLIFFWYFLKIPVLANFWTFLVILTPLKNLTITPTVLKLHILSHLMDMNLWCKFQVKTPTQCWDKIGFWGWLWCPLNQYACLKRFFSNKLENYRMCAHLYIDIKTVQKCMVFSNCMKENCMKENCMKVPKLRSVPLKPY